MSRFCTHRAYGTLAVLAFAVAVAVGCADRATSPIGPPAPPAAPPGPDPVPPPVDLSGAWTLSTPSAEGFDVAALESAIDDAAEFDNLRAIVVARNGRLVREGYFGGSHSDSAHDLRSVTKTVTALLVGIAVEQGLLSVDDRMVDRLSHESLRAAHEPIRIGHLLTMMSGMRWSDATDFNPWALSGRPVGYVLDQEVIAPPGQLFMYNTGGSHLLAAIVDAVAPDDALGFAEEHLFGPLGITNYRWFIMDDGVPAGGAGLALLPTDAAKLGQLLLQRGRSGDRQVVSEPWVATQTGELVLLGPVGNGVLASGGYGYQTWRDSSGGGSGIRAIVMWGYGGQFVWIVPDRQLVVVTANHWRGVNDNRFQQASVVARDIVRRIVGTARPIKE